jgi:hypothetical protein
MIASIINCCIRIALLTPALILLVGCTGNSPEATTIPNTLAAEVAATTEASPEITAEAITLNAPFTVPPDATQPPFPTIRPTIEGELIAQDSRTLVASRTEDPNSGDPFTTIRIERNGGPGSMLTTPTPPLIIEILGDGQATYGDQQGTLSQQTLDQINDRIRTIDFFGISGDFLGILPLEGTEEYLYKVTITRGSLTRSINARDGMMPQELRDFVAYLLQTAQQGASGQVTNEQSSTEEVNSTP